MESMLQRRADRILRVLDENGALVGDAPALDDERLLSIYRDMVATRAFDERALHYQRTGRLPAYYQVAGQEAQVGAAHALRDDDWFVIAYREQGIRLARGVTREEELAVFLGTPGRQWDPVRRRITPVAATIGSHLPHATGLAYALRQSGSDAIAVAVFGDGATSEADFHAALNFAGVWRAPVVFLCQNNQYAQSTPVAGQTASETLAQKADAYGIEGVRVDGMDALAVFSAVEEAARRARSGEGPTLVEMLTYRYAAHSSYDGVPVYRTREEEQEWAGRDPLSRFGAYLRDRGLIDDGFEDQIVADTIEETDEAMAGLESVPAVDRGFAPLHTYHRVPRHLAEALDDEARAAGEPVPVIAPEHLVPEPVEDPPGGPREAMTMVEALRAAIADAVAADDRIVVLGEDVGVEGGVFRVTEGLLDEHGADRIIDTPLSETGIAGTAVGMAIGGLRPVAEIEFAGFVGTAFDQITFHVARYRWRTFGRIGMPVVVRMPAAGGHQGMEGHSSSNEALFMHSPGLLVAYPSTAYDAKGLMATALASEDPVMFYEPIVRYFVREDGVPVEPYRIPFGKAAVRRHGTDVTVVAYGNAVHTALDAADRLDGRGVSCEVIDLRTLKPWDRDAVLDSVARTGRLVVVHEAPLWAGFGSEIVSTVVERAGYHLESPPARVGHADCEWGPAQLEPFSLVTPERIAAAVDRVMED